MATIAPSIDPQALDAFMARFVGDLGAAMHAPLVVIGDRLGLYRALAEGPADADELAERTGCAPRYLQEWLAAQAASGYVEYDGDTGRYFLTPEQVFTLADESSPAFVPGGLQVAMSVARDADKIEAAFRTGEGVGWHEHDHTLFHGTERFFRPGYAANLVSSWIPALEGVDEKLRAGGTVADVGCGHGASTILMAEHYPQSTFVGVDYHGPSITAARAAAERAGVDDRVTFEVASAADYPGSGYDLIAIFDSLHDFGDPVGAAQHARAALDDDGTFMIVEPFAHDALEDNLNPVGRIYYSASTLICTPNGLSQEPRTALGAQAGEARIGDVVRQAGFTRFRRAAETPFNVVFQARP